MMGNITSGIFPEGENHWALVSYDIKGVIGGASTGLTPEQHAARDVGWKTFHFVWVLRSGPKSVRYKMQSTKYELLTYNFIPPTS